MTMRAVRVHEFGAPSVMKVDKDVPIPEPADNEVLISVKAAGINPVDTYYRAGRNPALKLPYTPGFDAAGVVEKVGANVQRFKKGDRVFVCGSTSGTYAEFATVPESHAYPLPDNATFEEGAGLGVPYLTAHRSLFQLFKLQPHHTVFVHGASGAVGLAVVQLARRNGVKTVVGTAGTPEAIKLLSDAKLCGPDNVFNHRSSDYLNTLKTRFPKGFDLIVEMVANKNLAHDLQLTATKGTIMVVGARGPSEPLDNGRILHNEIRIQGVLLSIATEAEFQEAGLATVASTRSGTCSPLISKKYPFEQASDAHTFVIEDTKVPGKVLLIP